MALPAAQLPDLPVWIAPVFIAGSPFRPPVVKNIKPKRFALWSQG
jgi:hypothetical protein